MDPHDQLLKKKKLFALNSQIMIEPHLEQLQL